MLSIEPEGQTDANMAKNNGNSSRNGRASAARQSSIESAVLGAFSRQTTIARAVDSVFNTLRLTGIVNSRSEAETHVNKVMSKYSGRNLASNGGTYIAWLGTNRSGSVFRLNKKKI